MIERPLALGERDAPQLQLVLGAADELGARAVSIYSRASDALGGGLGEGEAGWVRHAAGVLVAREKQQPDEGAQPGEEAAAGGQVAERTAVERTAVEQAAAEQAASAVRASWARCGRRLARWQSPSMSCMTAWPSAAFEYGPAFQGVRGVWRRDGELFAEVELPAAVGEQAGAFALHPALLDAALHAIAAGPGGEDGDDAPSGAWLPFSWEQVGLFATGASRLRVSLALHAEQGHGSASLVAADEAGGLVATVGSLVLREVSAASWARGRGAARDSLFCLEWAACEGPPAARVPAGTACWGPTMGSLPPRWKRPARSRRAREPCVAERGGAGRRHAARAGARRLPPLPLLLPFRAAADAHGAAHHALELVQSWLADRRFADARLVLVTRGAVAARAEDSGRASGSPRCGAGALRTVGESGAARARGR